ncbi:LysM peptidoglycan-binding domain-containing protein [Vibrio cincinnatiensis]|uniref:LysM peptidoglycan-binding domain-containing protein n=1 Tax=Vibrio cincinnatiensis TaxID=675 RepID=UPI0012ACA300
MNVFIRYYRRTALTFSMLFISLSAHVSALASEPTVLAVKRDAPKTYIVVKGDTLWDISALYLDSPWLWPRLWQVNPEIDNPHLIYPGDKLTLVWRDGQPVLSLKPMVKLSPKVRLQEKQSLPTVEEGLLLPYLLSDRLIEETEIAQSLRVLGSNDGRQYLTKQDTVYISGESSHAQWGLYRPMNSFERGDKRMVALRLLATAERLESQEQVTALSIHQFAQEIMVNDLALAEVGLNQLNLSTSFFPRPAPQGVQATILGTLEGSQYAAKNQVVVIDHGKDDGLMQGSMFELYQQGATVYQDKEGYSYKSNRGEPINLPQRKVGTLMVIRPYDAFSLALVTNSEAPIDHTVLVFSPIHDEEIASSVASVP